MRYRLTSKYWEVSGPHITPAGHVTELDADTFCDVERIVKPEVLASRFSIETIKEDRHTRRVAVGNVLADIFMLVVLAAGAVLNTINLRSAVKANDIQGAMVACLLACVLVFFASTWLYNHSSPWFNQPWKGGKA